MVAHYALYLFAYLHFHCANAFTSPNNLLSRKFQQLHAIPSPDLFTSEAWPNICKELDELPLFCCANQQGQPLAYTIEVEDDEKRNVAMLYCDPSDAELELTKINQTTKQKDNGIIPFPLGKAFELWAANQAVLVPTKASIVQAGAPSGASPVGQEIPLFACMEIMQEQQQGQAVLPLFLSSDEAHQAVLMKPG